MVDAEQPVTVVMGIDPGSRVTGYGFLEVTGKKVKYKHSGVVKTQGSDLPRRLGCIYAELKAVIACYVPTEVAVEQVFMAYNVSTALKLGQARGAALVAAVEANLSVAEYSAKQIKQSVVGYGGADKHQMQLMIRSLLGLNFLPQFDEADALGVAWCHTQTRGSPLALQVPVLKRGRR